MKFAVTSFITLSVLCFIIAGWMYESKWYWETLFLKDLSDYYQTPEDKVLLQWFTSEK